MAVNLDSFKTLHIKRYSTEELIEFGTEALIQHLAKGHEIIIGDKISDIGDIPAFISKNINDAIPNMQELVRVYSEIAPLVVKDDEKKIFLDNIEAYKTDLESSKRVTE
jgi:glutaredoxin 2